MEVSSLQIGFDALVALLGSLTGAIINRSVGCMVLIKE